MSKQENMISKSEFMAQWETNEETMGEMAAFSVACEQLNIDEDLAWDLVAVGDDDEQI